MSEEEVRLAVYTGSFDPITLGHLNVIERSARLVDKLIVGIGINVEKAALFSPDERVNLVASATAQFGNVEVRAFSGLAVSFVRKCGARVMVRGIRPLTDIAAEFTMMLANRELDPDIEAVFLMADPEHLFVSSSLIKEVARFGGEITDFVPEDVAQALGERLGDQ